MSFSPEELERYARHIVLREIGGPGQAKLKAARVAVVGAGGLGCPALQYLAAGGVGQITIIDNDVVSLSNLQRQILFATGDVGRPKAEVAAERLTALNPNVEAVPQIARLTDETSAMLDDVDLVLDGSDNFTTRYLVNRLCVARSIPLISAAMTQWEGQIGLFDPARGGPCYECVFPEAPADGLAPSCAEAGILGALAGVVGSMMAAAALRHITGAGEDDRGTLLIYDALYPSMRRLKVAKRDDCPVCGQQAT
ncbi:MAG: HesA/MoeB/ThiF family protein [Pseudomonadota bacterium]